MLESYGAQSLPNVAGEYPDDRLPEVLNKKLAAKEKKQVQITPGDLCTACKKGDFKKIKLLVENGANVNEKDTSGSTPLHHAVYIIILIILFFLIYRHGG